MANSVVISRKNLIYGICLPLAVLLGYALAEPLDSGSMFFVLTVLAILCLPLLMRWHHFALIASCNAVVAPLIVPGRPPLWEIMTVLSLLVTVLSRSVGRDLYFFKARSVSYSLLVFGAVVVATIMATGGIGFAAIGSANFGGKKYLDIFLAIGLYFALSTPQINPRRAGLCVAVYFLTGLTGAIGYIASLAGPSLYFLVEIFPIEGTLMERASANRVVSMGYMRLEGIVTVGLSLTYFLLFRYGARGVLDLKRPWRIFLLLVGLAVILIAGYRSNVILFTLLFFAVFYLEGLFFIRHLIALVLGSVLCAAILLPNIRLLPLAAQRALSFMPLNVDPRARVDAEASTAWRVEMWKEIMPEVSSPFIVGKGFGLNPNEFFLTYEASAHGGAAEYEAAMLSGDFHNGPLSAVVCFGIGGLAAFTWFLFASVRVLRKNFRDGDPSLHRINTFLLALFAVKIIVFFFVFGSIYSDPAIFAGLVGLSVSLNGGVCRPSDSAAGEAAS